jgi:hypothetical protein
MSVAAYVAHTPHGDKGLDVQDAMMGVSLPGCPGMYVQKRCGRCWQMRRVVLLEAAVFAISVINISSSLELSTPVAQGEQQAGHTITCQRHEHHQEAAVAAAAAARHDVTAAAQHRSHES